MQILKDLKKKAGIFTLAAGLGLNTVFALGCGDIPNKESGLVYNQPITEQPKPISEEPYLPPEIISEPVTSGTVGEFYSYSVEVDKPANCELTEGPTGFSMNGNTLEGILTHISNDEVDKDYFELRCGNSTGFDYQQFELEIEPGIYNNKSYDHIQFIDVDDDGIDNGENDAVLLCETGYCSSEDRANNGELEEDAKGIKKALNKTLETIGHSYINEVETPIEVHLNPDSTCPNIPVLGTTAGNNAICDYSSFPQYPSESIQAHETIIHEDGHLLFRGLMPSSVQENFTYPLGMILSEKYGVYSFCDLDWFGIYSQEDYKFMKDMCGIYGFDIDDISELFSILHNEYDTGNYAPKRPVGNGFLKCALDKIVSGNTYDIFVDDVCNNLEHKTLCRCPDDDNDGEYDCRLQLPPNPSSSYNINPNYCGDEIY